MFFVRAGGEAKGTTAQRRHQRPTNSTDNQQHKTAQHGAARQATGGQGKDRQHRKMTAEPDSTAPRDSTAPQNTTQGSRPRGQTGTPTPKHATIRQPGASRPSTAPQNTKGNSTAHSSAPQHQVPATVRTTRTAQRKCTSTAKHSTAPSRDDRERTARHPRTHTAQSTAANNSTQQHATTKHIQQRAQSARNTRKQSAAKYRAPARQAAPQGMAQPAAA